MKKTVFWVALIAMLSALAAASALGEVVRLGDYAGIDLGEEDIAVEAAELEAQIAYMLNLYAETDAQGNRVVPELTDEFAREHLSCDSAEAYRRRLEGVLLEEKREASDEQRKAAYLVQLIEISEVTLEDAPLEARTAQYRASCDAYRQQLNMEWEAFCQACYGIDLETFEQALREQAAYDLKGEQLLDAVAQDMGITLENGEFAERREGFMERYGLSEAALAERYPDETLRAMLLREKLWERLLGREEP